VLFRKLSGDFQQPEADCPTYRALYNGLEESQRDLRQHVHPESNIVFPRALEMERNESACVHT
jgi:regulator of cell morphogenesis and NO signaling